MQRLEVSGALGVKGLTSITPTGRLVHVIAFVIPDLKICYFLIFRDNGCDTGTIRSLKTLGRVCR